MGESSKEEWFRLLFLFGVVAEESKNIEHCVVKYKVTVAIFCTFWEHTLYIVHYNHFCHIKTYNS